MSENEHNIKIKKKGSEEIPVEDIKDLLQMVNKEIPQLIKGLFSALYDVETAEQYAKGIGTIYRELNEQGLPSEMIELLVMKYADSINIVENAMNKIRVSKNKDEDD